MSRNCPSASSTHAFKAVGDDRQHPVVITDRGKPAHVLMTFQHYER
jgi:PHD/YefM family antitoxin component YafN of YafNO toxin-antitoxin module